MRRFVAIIAVGSALPCCAPRPGGAGTPAPQAGAQAVGATAPGNYGAIAFSDQSGRFGWAADRATQPDAERAAVAHCGAADCRAIVWTRDSCAAIARGADRLVYYSHGTTDKDAAFARAVGECSQRTTGCEGLAFTCTTRISAPVMRDEFGSIAYSKASGRFGWAVDRETRDEAFADARLHCAVDDCQPILWFRNSCGSIAKGANGAVHFSEDPSRETAMARALAQCAETTSRCATLAWACTSHPGQGPGAN